VTLRSNDNEATTVKSVQTFHQLLDILNSHSPFAHNFVITLLP